MPTAIDFNDKYTKITIALAGLFQAANLVDSLANTGQCDQKAFLTSINSLFKLKAPDVPSIYEGTENLKIGFAELCKIFNRQRKEVPNSFVSNYALTLIIMLRQLNKNPAMLDTIRQRIEHVISQITYFNGINDTVIANLADIYLKTLATSQKRMKILGKQPHLQNVIITNKIRALLLAGIRSAMLWRQVGGQYWQLFFARSKIYKIAKAFLEN